MTQDVHGNVQTHNPRPSLGGKTMKSCGLFQGVMQDSVTLIVQGCMGEIQSGTDNEKLHTWEALSCRIQTMSAYLHLFLTFAPGRLCRQSELG